MTTPQDRTQYLRGLVDMGSNGIRFSITDLSPPTARIMPTIYQDRAGISLYDAQYPQSSSTTTATTVKSAIPPSTIMDVLTSLKRFKRTCRDFGVPDGQIRVLATEATREAVNSVEFREEIRRATGWVVEMLTKEEEGRVGAMGVASSFRSVDGLVMDLGGGSTQMSWLKLEEGEVVVGEGGSVSLPYGAAALMRRLEEAEGQGPNAVEELTREVESRLLTAFQTVALHRGSTASRTSHGKGQQPFPLFLSGGGFRGWGNILLSASPPSPYPIPIINGFSVPSETFTSTSTVRALVSSTYNNNNTSTDSPTNNAKTTDDTIFRVSTRRASQTPAVAFLITCLTHALGPSNPISRVRFCQGGVREGALFASLPRETRAQSPVVVATLPYATSSSEFLLRLLTAGVVVAAAAPGAPKPPPLILSLLPAFTNTLYTFLPQTKETRPAASLRFTSTGALAGVHGLSHEERAALSLMLAERWGGKGELAPTDEGFFARLQQVVGGEVAWWCGFVGRVGGVVGEVWPAGVVGMGGGGEGREVGHGEERVRFKLSSPSGTTTSHHLHLQIHLPASDQPPLKKQIHHIEKLGKKKNWIGGWGVKVEVEVVDL